MLNVFLQSTALGMMADPAAADRAAPYRDAVIEMTDMPLVGVCRVEKDALHIRVYYREADGSRGPMYRQGTVAIGCEMNPGDDTVLFLFALALKLSCILLQERKLLDMAVTMEEAREGVHIWMQKEKLRLRLVAGMQRPKLPCRLSSGEVVLRGPEDWIAGGQAVDPLEALLQAARSGDEEAMEELAFLFLDGTEEHPTDVVQAMYWFRQLAERGHVAAQFNLGLHYAKGIGADRDLSQALYWMREAAQQGDEDAERVAQSLETAASAQDPAQAGDPEAQAVLAAFYMELAASMQENPQDEETALYWAQLSAQQGCAEGMYILGMAYAQGRAVEQDLQTAYSWYEKGAAQNHAPSLHAVAQMILQGDVQDRSDEEAFSLLLRAAKAGYVPAMRDTARCYRFGEGVEESMTEALAWITSAQAASDDPELAREAEWIRTLAGE